MEKEVEEEPENLGSTGRLIVDDKYLVSVLWNNLNKHDLCLQGDLADTSPVTITREDNGLPSPPPVLESLPRSNNWLIIFSNS